MKLPRITHGCTFTTPGGMYRKEYLDADTSAYPEADELPEHQQVAYVVAKLEEELLRLRWMFGNLTQEQYVQTLTELQAMTAGWLAVARGEVPAEPEPVVQELLVVPTQ